MRESLLLARSIFGSDSLATAYRLNNLAVNLVSRGHAEEAEQLFRESYERHVALLGEEHWRTSNVARNIGAVLALEERTPGSRSAWRVGAPSSSFAWVAARKRSRASSRRARHCEP